MYKSIPRQPDIFLAKRGATDLRSLSLQTKFTEKNQIKTGPLKTGFLGVKNGCRQLKRCPVNENYFCTLCSSLVKEVSRSNCLALYIAGRSLFGSVLPGAWLVHLCGSIASPSTFPSKGLSPHQPPYGESTKWGVIDCSLNTCASFCKKCSSCNCEAYEARFKSGTRRNPAIEQRVRQGQSPALPSIPTFRTHYKTCNSFYRLFS